MKIMNASRINDFIFAKRQIEEAKTLRAQLREERRQAQLAEVRRREEEALAQAKGVIARELQRHYRGSRDRKRVVELRQIRLEEQRVSNLVLFCIFDPLVGERGGGLYISAGI